MKENINILGEKFESEILKCKKEEDNVRSLEKQYQKALDNLETNNQKRNNIINEIRLNKIKEIEEELKISKQELEKMQAERQEILEKYCEKNGGHKYVLIKTEFLGYTGTHSFKYGREATRINKYQCTVCGRKKGFSGTTYVQPQLKKYKQTIPTEIYEDVSLIQNGKNLKEIEEEIKRIEEQIQYLDYLKRYLCKLFGHDVEKMNGFFDDTFMCKCCNRVLSYQEYINTYHDAKYRGIVPFYYSTYPEKDYVISSKGDLTLSLPTYKSYQRTLKKR